jgi:periplasmic protein TonB
MKGILSDNWTALIFEGRNKAYGAYQLRQLYVKNIINAFAIANLIFLFFCLLVFNFQIHEKNKGYQSQFINAEVKVLELNLTQLPKPKTKLKESWKIADEKEKLEAEKEEIKKHLFEPSIKTNSKNTFHLKPDSTEDKVDVNAKYPGGWQALMAHFMQNMVYDEEMEMNGVNTLFIVKFKIDSDGKVFNNERSIKIITGGNAYLNSEMIRLIRAMKIWTPAKKEGKNVKQWITAPIHITLPKH